MRPSLRSSPTYYPIDGYYYPRPAPDYFGSRDISASLVDNLEASTPSYNLNVTEFVRDWVSTTPSASNYGFVIMPTDLKDIPIESTDHRSNFGDFLLTIIISKPVYLYPPIDEMRKTAASAKSTGKE